MTSALQHTAERAAHEPMFLAYDLNVVAERSGYARQDVADWLGVARDRFDRLALCRSPRRDRHFRADLDAIASHAEMDIRPLVQLVRQADALNALASAPSSHVAPMLAAARQNALSVVKSEAKGKAMQPAWLNEAVNLIWGDEGEGDFPRDIELAVLWRLPLAIIEMQNLSGVNVRAWLHDRGVDLPVHSPPGSLRGAIVAFAGSGVLFLDSADDPRERRVTIAHEASHFAVDYWLPRVKLAARAPQLLEIVDGLRQPNQNDHIDALIARIPLGVHTHLFERDSDGAALDPAIEVAEERATRTAWELLAPLAVVSRLTASEDEFSVVRTLENKFGLPRETAREYSGHVRRSLARRKSGRNFDWS